MYCINISQPVPWSFAYQAGAGIQYDIKNGMYLLFSADYFDASSHLSEGIYYLKYDFGFVNIMFGTGNRVLFELQKKTGTP